MPFYTAQQLLPNTAPNPLFLQRGVKDYTHVRLNDLHYAYDVPHGEIAYDAYRANIDVFVAATLTKKTLNTYIPGIDIGLEELYRPPIGFPPISFVFREAVTADQIQKFIEKMSKSKVAHEPIFKTNLMVAYEPTDGFIRNLPVFAKDSCTSRNDTCTPESVKWIMFLWKVLDGFLRTNTYPAYMNEDGSDTVCSKTRSLMVAASVKTTESNVERMKLLAAWGTDNIYGSDAPMEEEIEHGHTTWSLEDVVLKAKPSPIPEGEDRCGVLVGFRR